MRARLRILHLEDDPLDGDLIETMLVEDGIDCDIVRVDTAADFVKALQESKFDLILADYALPNFDGNAALAIAHERCPEVPFLFVSGTIGEEVAVESLKRGATDYLLKQRLARLPSSVRRALTDAEDLVTRRRAQEGVRFQAHLLNTVKQAVIATDLRSKILYWNRYAETLFGWSEREAIGRPANRLLGTQLLTSPPTSELPDGWTGEIIAQRRDGSTFPSFVTVASVSDQDGNHAGTTYVVTDMTHQKQAQNAIEDLKTRLQHLVACGPIIIYSAAPEFPYNTAFISENVSEQLGYPAQDFLNEPKFWFNHVHPDSVSSVADSLSNLDRDGAATLEYEFRHKDGSYRYMRDDVRLIRNERGEPVEMIGAWRDITNPKQAQLQLAARARQQEAVAHLGQRALGGGELSALISVTTDLVAQTLDTQYSAVLELLPNSTALQLRAGVGWPKEHVGSRIIDAGQDSLAGYTLRSATPVVMDDIVTETRFARPELMHKLGIVSSVTVIIGGQDSPFGVLGAHSTQRRSFTLDDVHFLQAIAHVLSTAIERKRAEQSLAHQTVELTRSNSELEQFAYVASHDLQEPLRMVSSYLQLLQRQYLDRLDEDANEFIMYAVDGALRMQTLINNLLEFSRVGTHGRPFQPTSFEAVLAQVMADVKESVAQNGATITNDPLPVVDGDASQLVQLLQNLIGNALKFRSEHPPHIHISARANDTEFVFSVRDNGIGITPEFFDRIFVIFQRLHGRTEYPGTGIGLAVCKKIVERHGGRIWVESEIGKGTEFYFTIPRRPGNDDNGSR